ncbi:DUF3027 domain-containing protein [Corynebacterium caspium]|uniref:DUF3027 domain-containing protein n=1 Tax=Corynebacterium caspium TaxID=234828 RepID=UPI000378DA83|nr:DUF3027 domain-containing protein [Corynebacterium caspium]WKD58919.1 hypothetical protein CCASP_02560 [Corynebacterium caspium DSM 44850]
MTKASENREQRVQRDKRAPRTHREDREQRGQRGQHGRRGRQQKKRGPGSARGRRSANPLLGRRAMGVAKQALLEAEPGHIGPYIGSQEIDEFSVVHRFASDIAGYEGWQWQVVVARAAGSTHITISEIALEPAPKGSALRAPEWVPWEQRLRPGDLRPGDIMPPAFNDERLTTNPAQAAVENTHIMATSRTAHSKAGTTASLDTAGTGRHYLSDKGLFQAQQRWREGENGPRSLFAKKARAFCAGCAFFIPLATPDLQHGAEFGVCTNALAFDAQVVHKQFGCGAHSEIAAVEVADIADNTPALPFDDERPIYVS